MNKKLFVISGSSGVGKGTVLKGFLAQNPEFMLSISCTTRAPREGEIDGVNYFFLTKDEFKKCVDDEKFLEWAEFAGNCYGTKKKFINQCLEEGKNVILEIEIQGALKVREQFPDTKLIFVSAPSAQVLRNRLVGRGTEAPEVVEARLSRAYEESLGIEEYNYFVVKTIIFFINIFLK